MFFKGPLLGAQTIPQTICDCILTQTSPGAVSHPYLLAQEIQIDMGFGVGWAGSIIRMIRIPFGFYTGVPFFLTNCLLWAGGTKSRSRVIEGTNYSDMTAAGVVNALWPQIAQGRYQS